MRTCHACKTHNHVQKNSKTSDKKTLEMNQKTENRFQRPSKNEEAKE
jgi:hypothetical protein